MNRRKRIVYIMMSVIAVNLFTQRLGAQTIFVGERAFYKLTYLSVSAATVTISVPEKKRTANGTFYHIVATAKTNAFFSAFYSLDNRYDIDVDSATLLPVRMDKDIRQKTLEQKMTITYRHNRGDATYDGGKFTPPLTAPLAGDAHNFFSMIYWLRHQPLKTGDRYPLHLDVETEPWNVTIDVLGDDITSAAGKKYSSVKVVFTFIPTQAEKKRKKTDMLTRHLVASGTKLYLWLGKEEPHTFLKVEYEMSPFNVVTVLTGLE